MILFILFCIWFYKFYKPSKLGYISYEALFYIFYVFYVLCIRYSVYQITKLCITYVKQYFAKFPKDSNSFCMVQCLTVCSRELFALKKSLAISAAEYKVVLRKINITFAYTRLFHAFLFTKNVSFHLLKHSQYSETLMYLIFTPRLCNTQCCKVTRPSDFVL